MLYKMNDAMLYNMCHVMLCYITFDMCYVI